MKSIADSTRKMSLFINADYRAIIRLAKTSLIFLPLDLRVGGEEKGKGKPGICKVVYLLSCILEPLA